MTSCRQVAAALVHYAYGDLEDENDCDRVESHLSGCSACRADVLRYRKLLRVASRMPPPALPPRLIARLRAVLFDCP